MVGVKRGFPAARAIVAGLLLSGCVALNLPIRNTENANEADQAPVRTRTIKFGSAGTTVEGIAVGLVGNNSASLVANNSAGFGGASSPLVANNSAGYRILGLLGEKPIADAVVYLTNPNGQFFKRDKDTNEIFTTATDKNGVYRIDRDIPTDQPVIVNVIMEGDQREVGFTIPKDRLANTVNVSLSTTVVTEFLRDRADWEVKRGQQRTMADYDLSALPDLTDRTEKALAAGELATPSLRIGDITLMNRSYTVAIGKNAQGLGDAWAKILGYRVIGGVTFAGTGNQGGQNGTPREASFDTPKGVAVDKDGNVYVSEEGGHRIRKIDPNGSVTTVAGTGIPGYGKDGTEDDANGQVALKSRLNWPRSISIGPDGNLYFGDVFNMKIRVVCLESGTSYGLAMEKGKIYDMVGDPDCIKGQGQCLNGYDGTGNKPRREGDVRGAKLAGVRGIDWDTHGNMVFTDSWGWKGRNGDPSDPSNDIRHHVRVLAAKSGKFYGVPMQAGRVYTIFGKDGTYGFDGDEPRRAVDTPGDYLQSLVIDKNDNVYITDSANFRVRKIDTAGTVSTYAGSGGFGKGTVVDPKELGDGGPATTAKLTGPYGVAIDDKREIMYVSTRYDGLIRAIDMKTGIIRTVAGAGSGGYTSDGDAKQITLNNPHDLAVMPDGSLLETDSRGHKLFRFLLQMGY